MNIKNTGQKCFIWCILAALHSLKIHPEKASHYKKYEKELNLEGIEFPVKLNQIENFLKKLYKGEYMRL